MLECSERKEKQAEAAGIRSNFTRYAIFFTPQPGTALAAFGRSWFGRAHDASTLHEFSAPGLSGSGFAKLPVSPGCYNGLHVAFRPPFALRRGMGPDALKARLNSFARRRRGVNTGPLTLVRDRRFLVLRPRENLQALEWLSTQCLSAFDGFAAPLSADDRNERLGPHLSLYQKLLLESFGSPEVMSEFRFAFRLSGPLAPGPIERLAEALWPVLQGICEDGIEIDALSLLGDPGGRAPLRLISRHRLGG
jgi:Protein of unknown function (DUF1045)